jgi:3-phenylpropionate/cinnamic acid dioxygenase small subunit
VGSIPDLPPASPADQLAVCATLYRFAEGLDLRDWPLYRSVFTDEIEVDYSSYRPGSAGLMRADDWVARGRSRLEPLHATQHSLSNPRVSVDGDSAVCLMYVEAMHVVMRDGVPASYLLGGRYVDRLVRAGDSWKIAAVTLQVRWSLGDPSIVDLPVS